MTDRLPASDRGGDFNALDRVIAWISPAAAARRAHYRNILAYYEAATPSRLRKSRTAPGTGNVAVERAGRNLREQARYLEQNHDLARGILSDLVLKTIGPNGIGIEPQPQDASGAILDDFAGQLLALWRDWCKTPEVTWQHDWPSAQRLLARSWFRDGEVFGQVLAGKVPLLDHGSTVPLSIEMIECDMVPLDYQQSPNVMQGIECNAWGRPRAYWTLIQPPGEIFTGGAAFLPSQLKRIPADRMLHAKMIDRIRQLRGVSVFATVLQRLDDLKDYEESERIAAKVAASMAAYIKKGLPDEYSPDTSKATGSAEGMRDMKFRPGMIFDDLRPGEDIGVIDTKRPNPNLLIYRQGQLRGVASGTGTAYSSIARSYDGTYSSQRQELVESWSAYATLAAEFTSAIVRPVYETFVATAIAAGLVKVPAGLAAGTADDAIYIAPQMPWIDPESEMNAALLERDALFGSSPAIIRRRGGTPRDVLIQESRWKKQVEKEGLDYAPKQSASAPTPATTSRKTGT